jgi:hypothetical protein
MPEKRGKRPRELSAKLFYWSDGAFQGYKVSWRYRVSVWLTAAKMAIAVMATMAIAPPISKRRADHPEMCADGRKNKTVLAMPRRMRISVGPNFAKDRRKIPRV